MLDWEYQDSKGGRAMVPENRGGTLSLGMVSGESKVGAMIVVEPRIGNRSDLGVRRLFQAAGNPCQGVRLMHDRDEVRLQ